MELKDTKDQPQRLHSLDEFLAEQIGQQTRFPSLRLGANGVSWSRAGIKLPSDGSPAQVFAKLFMEDNPRLRKTNGVFSMKMTASWMLSMPMPRGWCVHVQA